MSKLYLRKTVGVDKNSNEAEDRADQKDHIKDAGVVDSLDTLEVNVRRTHGPIKINKTGSQTRDSKAHPGSDSNHKPPERSSESMART